jgi:predicted TIM-barrel fold metal-dependent hydrolase
MTRRQLLACIPVAAALRSSRASETPFERFDTHTHIHTYSPHLFSDLEDRDWRCLSICVSRAIDDQKSDLDEQIRGSAGVHWASKGRIAWATAFDPRGFEDRDFAERTIAGIHKDFGQDAIGVKIWKNIGMGIRGKSGYLLPDNPALMPVYEDIQKANKTLIAHLAEPDGAWLPLDKNNPELDYYSQHPEWHMYNKPYLPRKDAILEARDHILEKLPTLRVVGCHLGSDEEHWDRLAKRFDKYPNFAVDTAARVRYFVRGDHEAASAFLIKYQDRVLYGTDFVLGSMDGAQAAQHIDGTHDWDWRFFSTKDIMTFRDRQIQGLGLPEQVMRKIFRENAVRWLPGITKT